eukprot:scaffold4181_cov31-Attheya_sp.AAC.1
MQCRDGVSPNSPVLVLLHQIIVFSHELAVWHTTVVHIMNESSNNLSAIRCLSLTIREHVSEVLVTANNEGINVV